MYAGLSPFEALALYCVITYMDTVEGVYFPEGGMHAIPPGLAAAAEKAGATFRYGTTVERLVRPADGTAAAGAPGGGERGRRRRRRRSTPTCPWPTGTLLPDVAPPRVARKGHYSPSCSVWLAGREGRAARRAPPTTTSTSATRGRGLRRPARPRACAMRRPVDPRHQPDASDPSLAPAGRSSLYVLEPMPNLDGTVDWATRAATG